MRDLLKQHIPNITEEACDKFVAYYELLIDWNTRMNLTAITEPEETVKKHFLDLRRSRSFPKTQGSRTSERAPGFRRSRF